MTTSTLDDAQFSVLDPQQISSLFRMYDTDTYIQSAASIMLDSLLSGGITFKHQHEVQKKRNNIQESSRLQEVWTKWVEDLMRSVWTCGFAASIVVDNEPRILDLTQLEIRMRQDYTGRCQWRFYERHNGIRLLAVAERNSGNMLRVPIENVSVYVMQQPSQHGEFRSKLIPLLAAWEYELHLVQCSMKADRARAATVLVTQQADAKRNFNDIAVNPIDGSGYLGDGHESASAGNNALAKSIQALRNNAQQQAWADINSGQQMRLDQRSQIEAQRLQGRDFAPEHLELGANQTLANHKLPEGPNNVLQERSARQTDVFAAFGILITLSTDQKARATALTSTKAGSAGSNKRDDIFIASQKRLKMFVLTSVKLEYIHVHLHNDLMLAYSNDQKTRAPMTTKVKSEKNAPDKKGSVKQGTKRKQVLPVSRAEKRKKLEELQRQEEDGLVHKSQQYSGYTDQEAEALADRLQTELTPIITINSLPDEGVMDKLYFTGLLSAKGIQASYADRHGIDYSFFESSPTITVKELNGIVPKPPAAKGK